MTVSISLRLPKLVLFTPTSQKSKLQWIVLCIIPLWDYTFLVTCSKQKPLLYFEGKGMATHYPQKQSSKSKESHYSSGCKGPQRIMWSTLPREKEIRQDYLAPYCISKTSSNRDSITLLRRLFQWMAVLTTRKQKKKKILISRPNCSQCNMYPLSLIFSTWIDCFSPFCSCPLRWREIISKAHYWE